MLLDDLVGVIETLKERIVAHGASLRENETRTRMALIDPLLQALGWDVSNPGMVTPEYDVSGRKADYALLGKGGIPSATVEAKKLGEALATHRMQMLNYSNASGVEYAGLTDGDKWELYEVFKRGQLDERRILDISIVGTPVHEAALKLLLLWRPNLASGQPVAANEPLFTDTSEAPTRRSPVIESPAVPDLEQLVVEASGSTGWMPLSRVNPEKGKGRNPGPTEIRFTQGQSKSVGSWTEMHLYGG